MRTEFPFHLAGEPGLFGSREEREHALLDHTHARPSRSEDLLADSGEGSVERHAEGADGEMARLDAVEGVIREPLQVVGPAAREFDDVANHIQIEFDAGRCEWLHDSLPGCGWAQRAYRERLEEPDQI